MNEAKEPGDEQVCCAPVQGVGSERPKNQLRLTCGMSRRLSRQHRTAGFTLIEIMVVVAILAILGAAVVPRIMDRPEEARRVRAKTDMSSLSAALELYKLDNFNVPSTDQGLQALVEEPTGDPEPTNWKQGGYVQKLTKDPWGRDYVYISPGESSEYEIVSYARDGREGGEGFDADISSAE